MYLKKWKKWEKMEKMEKNGQPEGATNCSEIWCKTQDIAAETFTMLNTACGDVVMKRTHFQVTWAFRRQSIDNDERPGRPSTSTDDPHVDKNQHPGARKSTSDH